MKAMDTVMSLEEMIKYIPPITEAYEAGKMCERQAEITWEARQPEIGEAFKAGIKEVVRAIGEHHLYEDVRGKSFYKGGVSVSTRVDLEELDWWKYLLKEWDV